jgi:hypothetical protein
MQFARRLAAPMAVLGVMVAGPLASTSGAGTVTATATTRGTYTPSPFTPVSTSRTLAGVCPSTINVQLDWWPSADDAELFELIGPSGTVDINNNSYSGELGTTGVKVVLKAGGPAESYLPPEAAVAEYPSTYILEDSTDDQLTYGGTARTTGVFVWYQRYPVVLEWGNPKWDFKSVADIKASAQTVLAYNGAAYINALEYYGELTKSQVDESYNGSPTRFVTASGSIVQQDYITQGPYQYVHDTPDWDKPVYWVSVAPQYPVYEPQISVPTSKLAADTPCLKQLVPIIQQAGVEYEENPGPVNAVLVKITHEFKGQGVQLSSDGIAYTTRAQIEYGLVANGANGVFGSFSQSRLQKVVKLLAPVLKSLGKSVPSGVSASTLATNEFLDPSISLPARFKALSASGLTAYDPPAAG